MTRLPLNRRHLMLGMAGLGVSFAGRVEAGSSSTRPKLIVLVARGAMDGLSVTIPWSDPDYVALRGQLAIAAPGTPGGALAMAEGFGLHPTLTGLHGLYRAGQVRFAPAVAIPARIRSHFDAQDVLESGGETVRGQTDGWLNRALLASGGQRLQGLAIGAQTPLILRGAAATSSWAPGSDADHDERLLTQLMDLYAGDPLLGPGLARGLETEAMASASSDGTVLRRRDIDGLGHAIARLMTGEAGADVVAVSVDGWDTHARQAAQMDVRLAALDALISGLQTGLGEAWSQTILVIATEFGRTVRINGTGGTDHGTGSSLILAGGALKTGGPVGDWPTLAENRLFEGRDLMPSLDVRSVFKGVLRDHLGVDRSALDARVFPDSGDEAPAVDGLV